jgi:opacity protein-like surface antigen
MKHFGSTLVAGACAFFAQVALAEAGGDLLYPSEPAKVYAGGESGFYLRGQLGFSNHDIDRLHTSEFDDPNANFSFIHQGFETGGIFGGGVGYRWNKHLRFDVTGEYRGKSTFHGFDTYEGGFNFPGGSNKYTSTHEGWLGLFNAYVDLGTWWCFTPYVGAGVGWAKNTVDDFTDLNVSNLAVSYANGKSESGFAWAIHAGVAYEVTSNLTLDFGYRYTDLGEARTGTIYGFDGSGPFTEVEYKDLVSHDLMLSVRYKCCGTDAPIVPAYTPLK